MFISCPKLNGFSPESHKKHCAVRRTFSLPKYQVPAAGVRRRQEDRAGREALRSSSLFPSIAAGPLFFQTRVSRPLAVCAQCPESMGKESMGKQKGKISGTKGRKKNNSNISLVVGEVTVSL